MCAHFYDDDSSAKINLDYYNYQYSSEYKENSKKDKIMDKLFGSMIKENHLCAQLGLISGGRNILTILK